MKNIIVFIIKNKSFFLFILLETISLFFVFNNNYYQKSYYISSTNNITGYIYKISSNISGYFQLKQTNKTLARENAKLLSLKKNSFLINNKYDSIYKQQYLYIPARIISNTTNKRNNYLMLNKGRNSGIKKDMGVVCQNGVIGIVKDVSDNFSSVISILHSKLKISAAIKKNNQIGTLEWDGKNYRTGVLNYIPTHVNISVGDTIITSGYSFIFPKGIPIGKISKFKIKKGKNFYDIDIIFFTDYNKISYVYIINNILKKEQLDLQTKSQNE
ncbi:MAG: rod shape-determining protein MreC [Bacteroidales bacterium]|nr:rod shape-determining protein MreC [Bacteroidales bacterium]